MNFFDRFPPPAAPAEPEPMAKPSWMKPDDVFGGVVAAQLILARGDEVVLGVNELVAYPNGFSFTVATVLRREDRRGHLFHLGCHHDSIDGEPPVPEFLRLGVQFADGTAVSNLGAFPRDEPDRLGMTQNGGGGGGQRHDMSYWVWPLPPPGPVTFVCEWPAFGIGESRAGLDARSIHDAAARAVRAWP
jgi:hypothetical protein